MEKKEIVKILNEIGLLLELKGENPFKSRAYYNAARIIELLDEDIETIVKEDRLKDIKGIGEALNKKITELVLTGKLKYYEDLKASIPEGLIDMLKIPGLGPKRIRTIYEQLNITSVRELEYACLENRLLDLPGFGKKMQNNILKGIQFIKQFSSHFLYSEAYSQAVDYKEYLDAANVAKKTEIAGSLRRKKEIVKDIDILSASNSPNTVIDTFIKYPKVKEIVEKGDTKSSVILEDGIGVDLRVIKEYQFPYALHHFTGSKEHNTAMRHRAKKMGIKMNEYGIFKGEELIKCLNEEEIFFNLGLSFIPPELRENMGEIEAAEKGTIPNLVDNSDLKGILHVHTRYSDGTNSLKELVEATRNLGYSYLGVSDHSKSAYYANGLNEEQLFEQWKEIDNLNQIYNDFRIFKGIESDILPDGSLDFEDEILEKFDFVIASVHSNFNLNKQEMTERIIKALTNKYTTILGHPTGRLLLARNGYDIDMEKIIEIASSHGKIIEINSNPYRLDLDWRYIKYAKEKNVIFAICPDAHNIEGLSHITYGIGIAKKGWLEAKDVINTLDIESISKFLKDLKQ
ncbi:MAG: DNA polymerase/3'-5' exonuclease PolX [Defluviitoga tunisiensis]|jgi:DNA polymerase (family 10)|uniref:DNA polymerase beta n=1 Tax=Defluviitoga tunisiensis TaxID=1006576 RepID=A0A0C7P3Y3_DEFTU|nr:DNA polymerase/3'-5' exonuclease PolX [Defluviitoga tunisiensis]MDD3600933.1 DNA polymerase/3'-5' exonuclease PolX [Defluviitoga tunisiensis]MDY0379019.1 DNA polymerase/3'-5' exonuclease PolX [Defluviitoga tunisiensis]CEP78589.1 DNA polymerase/3'-5' exonuclease PolX [Defluviitoga tunisiensis]HOP33874.1 DNA polymerase/3'-5' exonuclease PolX [Defluviitoga tunisiensis]